MKLYIAGLYTSNFDRHGRLYLRLTDNEKRLRDGIRYYLESYHYVHKQSFVDKMRRDKVKVFLDSGAFSAFTKGVKVDIRGYCDYILRNKDILENVDGALCASVLDGIGDPLLTWQNQQTMEKLGVRPLPCFHYGEDERYLEWYIANYDYITLGGMVPIDKGQLVHWLDRLWDRYLTDGAGRPRLRVHGFGLTTYRLMERYPWYSVDSSSWVQQAANGNVVLTDYRRGSVIYLPVSSSSPTRKTDGRHITTMTALERAALERHVESKGVELARVKDDYLSRWAYNAAAYDELGTVLTKQNEIFTAVQETLF